MPTKADYRRRIAHRAGFHLDDPDHFTNGDLKHILRALDVLYPPEASRKLLQSLIAREAFVDDREWDEDDLRGILARLNAHRPKGYPDEMRLTKRLMETEDMNFNRANVQARKIMNLHREQGVGFRIDDVTTDAAEPT